MNPKSNTLFHFTKNVITLQSILKNGFWPRYCQEDVSLLTQDQFDFISFPMVCFCDIPLSRIEDHVGFYGRFGLGMSRKWAEQNGLNPVLYLPTSNTLSKQLLKLNEFSHKLPDAYRNKSLVTNRYIYAHTKPGRGTMIVAGVPAKKDFYNECEWRFVATHVEIDAYLTKLKHEKDDVLDKANNLTREHCMLSFDPGDVRYIFVELDSDIPSMMNFIQSELDGHSGAALKILSSRVLSLESLNGDL